MLQELCQERKVQGFAGGLWVARREGGSRIFSLKRIPLLGDLFLKISQAPHLEGAEWAAGCKGQLRAFCKSQVQGDLRASLPWEW